MKQIPRELQFNTILLGHGLTLVTTWGLFSPERVDDGSRLLLEVLKVPERARILDLGCGYGPIGLALAKAYPDATVELVDKDFVAVEYTERNAQANGLSNARSYLSNGFDQVETRQFDLIVSNLPAKVSGELYEIWLEEAKSRLVPGGQLVVVTISGLRQYIKRQFNEVFGNYEKLVQNNTYTVAQAVGK